MIMLARPVTVALAIAKQAALMLRTGILTFLDVWHATTALEVAKRVGLDISLHTQNQK